jgi:hypothetical protein
MLMVMSKKDHKVLGKIGPLWQENKEKINKIK